jgi:hypothetical protein
LERHGELNQKVRTIRNEIQLDGINQFNTPILSNNPETNYNVSGSLAKKYTAYLEVQYI